MHHQQDLFRMGGLRAKMPITFWTMVIATLCIMGFPRTSGFFSKDEILYLAYLQEPRALRHGAGRGGLHGLLHVAADGPGLLGRAPGPPRLRARPREPGRP